jgi:hypothetical protein
MTSDASRRTVASWRWWFEDRRTGRIVVAQFPNWPILGIGIAWVVRAVADRGSTVHDAASAAVTVLWIWWAGDELLRGVNPFRRVLGAGVLAWQLARLVLA